MRLKRNFIDRVKYRSLLFIFLGLTLLSSVIYFVLSLISTDNGLVTIPIRELTFWDTLYYSFVVQTTLGCGDIQAIGFSRLFTCLQVAAGLVIAGITVTKITSREGRKINYIRKYAEGYWLEPFRIEGSSETMFTLTEIYYDDENEEIKYKGYNYFQSGKRNGNDHFEASFIGFKDNTLVFMYKNPNQRNIFDEGIMYLRFSSKIDINRWDFHESESYDHKKGERTMFCGWRANKEEIKIFLNGGFEQKSEIIQKYVEKFENNYI